MPYLATAQSFLEKSTLLISARPTTAKITTKYTLPKKNPILSFPPDDLQASEILVQAKQRPPKTTLTVKTYDPVSGTCLKYRTDKAAEVGRLVATLGACGRVMAALPPREETGEIPQESEAAAPINVEGERKAAKGGSKDAKGGQGPGKGGDKGGGGGKKKKGKR